MQNTLKRDLKARHLTMIAIGGSIGTGLFVGSGATIAQAGPAGALLCYVIIGLMVYFLMTSLGELAAYLPVSGTFATYGARYVDESFGFAIGWNYWYNWAITVAVDLVAAQLVISYWLDSGSYSWLWSLLFLSLIFALNYISVKGFGEAEFWFALIKVVTVIVFIILGVAMIADIFLNWFNHATLVQVDGVTTVVSNAPSPWQNWQIGDAPFVGGFASMIGVAMIVGFSFQGTELIGIAAGESEEPEKNIPKSMKQVFWRILLFYVLAIFVVSLIIPYTDPLLLRNDEADISVSPFTLVFENSGLLFAAALMNAVILTSVLSAGNSGMYASTRMLYALAKEGKAPRIFARLSKSGVPRMALFATTCVAMLCFLTSMFEDKRVYLWLLNLSGMTGFIAWLGIAISHYRFRKGYIAQGLDIQQLPYRSSLFPFGPIFAFVLCLIITLGQNYEAFLQDQIDWNGAIATYIGIPMFLLIMLGYKLVKRTKWVKYQDMDFSRIKP
ncbi:lysine:proton symporter (AAT family) [Orbus hercynius]|uniref:Lysine:proton symporter (AAT family) n=1 Tax=Orbus hercynius TaxID=593135 RepID=A0A495RHV1_9GAMM|nr:amino acid permease [Orbus hercynius]RKS87005.1 lysine:proton symporter (AAT family) [Orbus hercynius]